MKNLAYKEFVALQKDQTYQLEKQYKADQYEWLLKTVVEQAERIEELEKQLIGESS